MNRQRRRMGEIRAAEVDGAPGVTLRAITPNVVDDYGSVWMAHCFDQSLEARLPVLAWAHDWSEPLGPAVSFETSDQGPTVAFKFSDFDAVPMARRAHAQVADGTITDCSVGFWVPNGGRRDPTDAELEQWPGCREVIERANLDEVSLVLRGAVPGAKVLALRSGGMVAEDAVVDLARKVAAGELTQAEAKAALALLADEQPPPPDDELDGEGFDADLAAEAERLADDVLGEYL